MLGVSCEIFVKGPYFLSNSLRKIENVQFISRFWSI